MASNSDKLQDRTLFCSHAKSSFHSILNVKCFPSDCIITTFILLCQAFCQIFHIETKSAAQGETLLYNLIKMPTDSCSIHGFML